MTLYRVPGSANWHIRYSHRGKQYRESSGSPDERVARALLQQRLAECGADQLGLRKFAGPQAERLTMAELFDALEADFRLRGIKSLRTSLSHLNATRREFGHFRAVEISPALVDNWYQHQLTKGKTNDNKGNTNRDRFNRQAIQGPCKRDRQDRGIPGGGYNGSNDSSIRPVGDRPATGDYERTACPSDLYNVMGTGVPHKPATLNRVVSMVSQALKLAARRQQIAPAPILRKLPEPNARQGFFSKAEFQAVLANLPEHLRDFTQFAYLTGWRLGEIRGLRWADVDLAGRVIRLPDSKNGQGRMLALEGELWELVSRQRRGFGSEALFQGDGKPIGDFSKSWHSACQKANCPGRHFHDLRRTFARNARSAGIPETVIMAMTGHKTRSMFIRYAIVDEADQRQAQVRLQGHLAGQPAERKVLAMP